MNQNPSPAQRRPANTQALGRKKKKKKRKHIRSFAAATFLSVIIAVGLTGLIVVGYVLFNVATFTNGDIAINLEKEKNSQNQTSFLYANDKDGNAVEQLRLHGVENRIWVDKEEMPEEIFKTVVALEDKRFYDHSGVDWYRTIGVAVKQNGEGGSTITQQLVKNLTNQKEVTYVRKFKEILNALNLEKNYDKDTILEAYLNTLYLGQGCYGLQTAAETYFGKNAKDLNLAECAVLVVITKKPYGYDPLIHPEENRKRQLHCLNELLEQEKISQKEYDEAVDYELIFTNSENYVPSAEMLEKEKQQKNSDSTKRVHTYYEDFVISQVIKHLQTKCNYSSQEATRMIYGGGLKIYSAVDLSVQSKLASIYENRSGFPREYSYKSSGKRVQSSMTIMDYSGRVVAVVGGADKKTANRVLNRSTDSPRPPGSTIKPITAYTAGIEEDTITWSSYIKDYAFQYAGNLWPKNYSGNHGSGDSVSVQNAVTRSLNTVPARIVVNMVGVDKTYDYLKNAFHISTLVDSKDASPAPMVVGSMTYGITSLDLTAAYAVFGSNGKYFEPYSYYKVVSNDGTVLLDNSSPKGEQVISAGTAEVMREMLKTVVNLSYGTGYGYKVNNFATYAKTGTSDDMKDKWFVGGTPHYVASVWYGYDYPKAISSSSSVPAGTIFKKVMDEIHKDLDKEADWESSGEAVKRYYCLGSGKLASSTCSSTSAGWYKESNLPGYCYNCNVYGRGTTTADDPEDTTKSTKSSRSGGTTTTTKKTEKPTSKTSDNTNPDD